MVMLYKYLQVVSVSFITNNSNTIYSNIYNLYTLKRLVTMYITC